MKMGVTDGQDAEDWTSRSSARFRFGPRGVPGDLDPVRVSCFLRGLPVFTGVPDESTALFTFFTDTTTTQVINDGPIRVIDRNGTLTIYKDSAPNGNFADPNSFRDGTSSRRRPAQQVILDTTTSAFTARNLNTVTSTRPLEAAGKLGHSGGQFRTIISGHLNTTGAPSAYMAGYTVP